VTSPAAEQHLHSTFRPHSDADASLAVEQIEARGAEVVQDPMDQPYGVRDCAVRDPAGNMIRYYQL
jgi:uncharacterized glyoxalase superfamily protein PhnB